MPRTECPISRESFFESNPPLVVGIDNLDLVLQPKEFGTGSFGWMHKGNITIQVNGIPTKVYLNLIATVVGSKES